MNRREQLAKDNGMTIEFVNWFFDNKKDGCGNAWLVMMAAMWEGWKYLSEQRDALVAAHVNLKLLADTYRQAYEEARARIAELEARTVKLPAFDGYQEHIVSELQAAFRIACGNAGINLETGGEA